MFKNSTDFMKNEQMIQWMTSGIVGGLVVAILGWAGLSSGRLTVPATPGTPVTLNQTGTVQALDVADVVERINPAVVSIVITKDVPIIEQYYEDPFSDFFWGESPFRFRIPRFRQNGTQSQEIGGGSGFFVSKDGYVVTNAHVVSDEDADYTVFTNDEQRYSAQVVAVDDVLDVAVLKVEGTDFSFLEFGDSDKLRLGQAVIAIGNALGEFRNTVSTGVVSGLSRSILASSGAGMSEALENVIQTDAAINPGNSGGPLLDLSGRVIGVNVAVAQFSENIGFSLPANAVKLSVESMIEHGKVVRPYLGVRYLLVNESIAQKNNLSVDYGALVIRGQTSNDLAVIPGSPADKAGLQENDIILEIDGQKVDAQHSLSRLIRLKKAGDSVKLKILHKNEEKDLIVKLEESP